MDIFSIAEFQTDPSTAIADINEYLAQGMPVNITRQDVRQNPENPLGGLMHTICEFTTPETLDLAEEMVQLLFEYGASWLMLDSNNKTPGCICIDRGIPELYKRFLSAGITSEVFLRRMTEEVGVSEPMEDLQESRRKRQKTETLPEENIKDYLQSDLRYDESTLQTSQNDGVMMDWETPIMKRSAEVICKPQGTVLNVGFGMGIIDSFIQDLSPAKHYIVEAHPAVLAKMRADGWFDKPNVEVLKGEWKNVLPELLSKGVTFDGIYYDTFSEHYSDMLEFFDLVCGLLDFGGTFSFFNGLGADRQICYDVYKEVVQVDLAEYGLQVEYEMLPVHVPEGTWTDIKRSYFNLEEYALPKISFKLE